METLVSVIIPTYKRHDTVCRAVDSVINQSYKYLEIIVVDDNEPDSESRRMTEIAMTKYITDPRIIYIKHPRNMNGSAARNTGFRQSNGEYIAFLDDDDEFCPQKIEAQVKCLNNRDLIWAACYADYIRVDSRGKTVMRNGEHREGNLFIEELKRNLFIHAGSNIMVRRSVFKELDGFDEAFLRNQDIEFMVRLLNKYKLAYVHTPGVIIHIHKSNSIISSEELTKQYRENFSHYIDSLEKKETDAIDTYLNLQIFRSKIAKRNTRIEGLGMITNGNVRLSNAIRYCMHLVVRRLTKKAYGFKL